MLPPVPNDGYPLRPLRNAESSSKEGSSTPRANGEGDAGRCLRSSNSLPPISDRMARSAPAGLDLSQPETVEEPGVTFSARGDELEDDLEEDLRELEELAAHLAQEGEAEPRPYTGEIESTTAPASSLATASVGNPEDCGDANEDPLEHLQGAIRVHQELAQLRLPHGCRLETSQASGAQLFFSMDVAEGPFAPASLVFWVKIFSDYPLQGSVSIRSTKRIFHPSVDAQTGAVALGTGEECGAKVNLGSMLTALAQMVKVPQPAAEPLNSEASSLLSDDPAEFRRAVRLALSGGEVLNVGYDRVLNLKVAAAASVKPAVLSEKMRLDLMNIEVLKGDFKATAAAYSEHNQVEMRRLMVSPWRTVPVHRVVERGPP